MYIPDYCYRLNAMTINPKTKIGKVVQINALEKGYYETKTTATQEEIDKMNDDLGIDKPTAKAMGDASMFGWDCYNTMLRRYYEIDIENANKENK